MTQHSRYSTPTLYHSGLAALTALFTKEYWPESYQKVPYEVPDSTYFDWMRSRLLIRKLGTTPVWLLLI